MSSTTTAVSIAASPLFKLPAELRLRIYEYVLYSDNDGICEVTRKHGIPEPGLLFTCKTVRDEGVAIFYTVNSIRLVADSFHPAVHNLIARKVTAIRTAGMHLGGLEIEIFTVGRRNFQNLTLWVQYIHSGKTLDPCATDHQVPAEVEPESKFVDSLFRIAEGMRERPWTDVERIVVGLRGGLVALNEEWKADA